MVWLEYYRPHKGKQMKSIIFSFCAVCSFVLSISSVALAQNAEDIVHEFARGNLPIGIDDAPLLLPFAMEWDAQASAIHGQSMRAQLRDYVHLMEPNSSWLEDSVRALAENDEALFFFSSAEMQNAFDETYEHARQAGSSIGLIPHDQAMRYWMLSQAISAGPSFIERFPGDPQIQWCFPPFIRCVPPAPLPEGD